MIGSKLRHGFSSFHDRTRPPLFPKSPQRPTRRAHKPINVTSTPLSILFVLPPKGTSQYFAQPANNSEHTKVAHLPRPLNIDYLPSLQAGLCSLILYHLSSPGIGALQPRLQNKTNCSRCLVKSQPRCPSHHPARGCALSHLKLSLPV